MKKRILIFSLMYEPYVGGAEIAVREITNRLPDIEFDMITLRADKRLADYEKVGNVNVYRVGWPRRSAEENIHDVLPSKLAKYLFPFQAVTKALVLHRARQYDAIWSIMANYAGFAALFFKLLRPRISYILTLQEGDPISHIKKRVGMLHPFFKMIFTKADLIQTISNYLKNFARTVGYTGPIEVVPNGVDTAHFGRKFSVYEMRTFKRSLGKRPRVEAVEGQLMGASDDIFIITTSRLVRKNGLGDLISSLTYLPNNIKLLILGLGPDLTSLKDLVERENLMDRVSFLGQVSHGDLPKYLQASDIFARPSLSEGFGNSFIEAMAARLPVVATPVGGIPDFLIDPSNSSGQAATGLFCEPNNPASIAEKVKYLLSHKHITKELVKNAHVMVQEKYDWNIVARKMRDKLFNKIFLN